MATFPPKLKFPQKSPEPIECEEPRSGKFNFLLDMYCEGHQFTTFINNNYYLQDKKVYYFIGVHLIIPKFFSKVEVHPDTGDVLYDVAPPLNIEVNQLFAMGLRSPKADLKNSLWDDNIEFDYGFDNCGKPAHSFVPRQSNLAAKSQLAPSHNESNIHQLFFKFHNHYFVPFVLSNGQICYYAFERKDEIRRWVDIFKNKGEHFLAINRPIEYNNMLRIPFSRKVEIVTP